MPEQRMVTIYVKEKTFGTCPNCNEQLPWVQSSFHFNMVNNAKIAYTESGWLKVTRPNTRGSGNDVWLFNPEHVMCIQEYMEEYEEEPTK